MTKRKMNKKVEERTVLQVIVEHFTTDLIKHYKGQEKLLAVSIISPVITGFVLPMVQTKLLELGEKIYLCPSFNFSKQKEATVVIHELPSIEGSLSAQALYTVFNNECIKASDKFDDTLYAAISTVNGQAKDTDLANITPAGRA